MRCELLAAPHQMAPPSPAPHIRYPASYPRGYLEISVTVTVFPYLSTPLALVPEGITGSIRIRVEGREGRVFSSRYGVLPIPIEEGWRGCSACPHPRQSGFDAGIMVLRLFNQTYAPLHLQRPVMQPQHLQPAVCSQSFHTGPAARWV